MTTNRLFGNSIKPACRYCEESLQQVGESMLCVKKGIVPQDFTCKRFRYDPLKRIPARPLPLERFTEEDFSIT